MKKKIHEPCISSFPHLLYLCHAKVIINSNDWYYHRNIFGMLVHFPFIEQLSQAERKTIVEIDKAYCFATSCENETKMLSKYLLIYYFFFSFSYFFFSALNITPIVNKSTRDFHHSMENFHDNSMRWIKFGVFIILQLKLRSIQRVLLLWISLLRI